MNHQIAAAINFSEAAYMNGVARYMYLRELGATRISGFASAEYDVQGFVCQYMGNIWVALRGTEILNIRDWYNNLDCGRIETPWGGVHRGFRQAAWSVLADIERILDQDGWPTGNLIFTGHSQGGAIAEQLTTVPRLWKYHNKEWSNCPACISIEAPRSMFKDAAQKFGTMYGHRITRIRNNNDIVPLVPPRILGFRHVQCANLRYITADGFRLWKIPFWVRVWDIVKGCVKDIGNPGPDILTDHYIAAVKAAWTKGVDKT